MKNLKEEYAKLKYADSLALEALTEAHDRLRAEGLSYEQRVEKYGENRAARENAPILDAHEVRRATMAELRKFRDEHPLIVAIVDGTRCHV
ncbi:hypothetical protein [Xanthomonas sacchari]|uniref:hypothetical protein n=1 Tax=Xanthomonas sacchari TaxID=56458 RepID=UPI00225DE7EC|nr:hypothetical protein [Xanthomonas sacchari]